MCDDTGNKRYEAVGHLYGLSVRAYQGAESGAFGDGYQEAGRSLGVGMGTIGFWRF